MRLSKENFYQGAFLSALLNKGIMPVKVGTHSDQLRNTYCISSGSNETNVYVKCSEKPASRNVKRNTILWSFTFTVIQQQTIKLLADQEKELLFAFVCGNETMYGSKIVILEAQDVIHLLDLDGEEFLKAKTIKIRLTKNDRYYRVYSSIHYSPATMLNVKVNNFDNYFVNEIVS